MKRKAFRFKINFEEYEHPEDLMEIYEYLKDVGELNTDPYNLATYWRKFSKANTDKKYAMSEDKYGVWLIPTPDTKYEFALYLAEEDI